MTNLSDILNVTNVVTDTSTSTLTNKTISGASNTITNLTSSLDAQLQDVAGLAVTDGGIIVGNGSNFVLETGSTARTSLGLGTIATQAADSVNIDGGAIDGTTIGTNSAITEAQIDNININGNTITSTDGNGNIALTPNGTGVVQIDGSNGVSIESGVVSVKNSGTQSEMRLYCESSNAHYAGLKAPAHATFSGDVTSTLPSVTGTLVGTANADAPTTTTISSDADHVLVNDGGVMKKITPSDLGIGGGGGGLTHFTEARSTSSPNNTVPTHSLIANGTETNIDVVLGPKGTGAFLLEVPDSTTTGGNKRGIESVDLQINRTSADQVASGGLSSIVGGRQNTASGSQSTVVGGRGNTSSGTYSLAGGRASNATSTGSVAIGDAVDATSSQAVALGYGTDATGSYSFAVGSSGTASGYTSVALGNTHTCSGDYSFAAGGFFNTCSGESSVALGYYNENDGEKTVTCGYNTNSKARKVAFIIGSRNPASDTNAVTSGIHVLGNDTTDATQTLLGSYNAVTASNQILLDPNQAVAFKAMVIAHVTGGGDTKAWELLGCIKIGASAGTAALVGSLTKTVIAADSGASSWDCGISIDTTTGAFTVNGTGAASTNIRWGATVYTTEVDY
jgi:hypothetical protein